MSDAGQLAASTAQLMPEVIERLEALVRIPSVAFPGFDPEPVHRMGAAVVELFEAAGATGVDLLDVPDGYPCVYADLPGPRDRRPCCSTRTTTCSRRRRARAGRASRSSR